MHFIAKCEEQIKFNELLISNFQLLLKDQSD